MGSAQNYFQLEKELHPEPKRMVDAFEKLSDDDRAALNSLRAQLPEIGEQHTGNKLVGLGPQGFLELLCRLATFKRATEIGVKPDLSKQESVVAVVKSI